MILRSVNEIHGYSLEAVDGSVGRADEFLFDDTAWIVRYLVLDTGGALPGQRVLIAPGALGAPAWHAKTIPTTLDRAQIAAAPVAESDKPVSRQHEVDLYAHYAWEPYWLAAPGVALDAPPPPLVPEPPAPPDSPPPDPHLHSSRELIGYRVEATDDHLGHVEDLIVDAEMWELAHWVLDTRDLLPGGEKLLGRLDWIAAIDWPERTLRLNVDRATVEAAPRFEPDAPVNAEPQVQVRDYRGRPAER